VRPRQRPFYRSILDGLIFLLVLTAAVALIQRFGGFDLDSGSVHVIDGDSLRMGGVEVRLQGIDAPEHSQICKDRHGAKYPCGKQAANILRGLAAPQKISCTSHEIDRYGRSVAICMSAGQDLNAEMVRLGWAVAYVNGSAYRRHESEARRAKRGLWAGEFEMPETYRARQRAMQGGLGDMDGAAGQD
jgi:endonuclease YncB( thermonuclease family)